jgi:hypothetical protein
MPICAGAAELEKGGSPTGRAWSRRPPVARAVEAPAA